MTITESAVYSQSQEITLAPRRPRAMIHLVSVTTPLECREELSSQALLGPRVINL